MVSFFERVLSILRVSAQFSPFDNLVAQPVGIWNVFSGRDRKEYQMLVAVIFPLEQGISTFSQVATNLLVCQVEKSS